MGIFKKPGWRGYRPNVCIIILDHKGRVFMGERSDLDNCWQTVQGGVEKDQSIEEAVRAEILEEVGLNENQYDILMCKIDPVKYTFPKNSEGFLYRAGWAGQEQWFHLARKHRDASINISSNHKEFKSYKWGSSEDLLNAISDMKKPGIEDALRAFGLIK